MAPSVGWASARRAPYLLERTASVGFCQPYGQVPHLVSADPQRGGTGRGLHPDVSRCAGNWRSRRIGTTLRGRCGRGREPRKEGSSRRCWPTSTSTGWTSGFTPVMALAMQTGRGWSGTRMTSSSWRGTSARRSRTGSRPRGPEKRLGWRRAAVWSLWRQRGVVAAQRPGRQPFGLPPSGRDEPTIMEPPPTETAGRGRVGAGCTRDPAPTSTARLPPRRR